MKNNEVQTLTDEEMESYLKNSKKVGTISKIVGVLLSYGIILAALTMIASAIVLSIAGVVFGLRYLF